MASPQRILFPTDFSSCAERAWPVALAFAEELDARLDLFHAVVIGPQFPDDTGAELRASREVLDALEDAARQRLAERVKETSATARAEASRALSPAQAIIHHAAASDADLIVMGTHGRGGLGRLLLGSVARDVLRASPCPVVTVCGDGEADEAEEAGSGGRHGPGGAALPPRRIAVGVDLSDAAARALRYADALAHRFGATLAVGHVSEEALYPEFYYPVLAPGMGGSRSAEEVGEEVDEWLRQEGVDPADVDCRVLAGRAAIELSDWAEETDADLLVVGSHGRRGFRRLLVGSVAEEVVRRCRRPVLTVRPQEEEEQEADREKERES